MQRFQYFFGYGVDSKYVQAVLRGLKPCVAGIVLAMGVYLVIHNCLPLTQGAAADIPAIIITAVLTAVMLVYPRLAKKKLSPILLICISAVLGMIVYTL